MSDQTTNAIVAIVLGSGLAVLLFAPVAAVQYRIDGRLQPRDLAILLSGAIYALSLWTYTLLPMPEAGAYACVGQQTDLLATIRVIWHGDHDGALALLRDPAFLQVALNVLLFVPLGYFLRVIARRGVITALLVGFAISLLIETTQATGVWNLYDCAYRLFDVDDLLINTVGAVFGSLVSWVFVNRRDESTPPLPTHVTLGRRLVGLGSDVLVCGLLGMGAAIAHRAWGIYGPGTIDDDVQRALLLGVPWLVQAVCVFGAGRTIGELVVAVRPVPRGAVLPARVIKFATGVSPLFVLLLMGERETLAVTVGLPVLVLVQMVVAWRTAEHRGLSNWLARMDLRIETGGVPSTRTIDSPLKAPDRPGNPGNR